MGGAAATLALALATSGCGLASMDASTSCGDFLHATLADQDAAVSKVASDLKAGNAVTPLGRPNISYLCANDPDMTLGDAVRHTG
jgi:hypothetical protein